MSEATPAQLPWAVPPSLSRLRTPVGVHRKAMKILAWGADKSGKSKFLSQFPSPKVVIDASEYGIQQYIDPNSGDECFSLTHPDELTQLVNLALKEEKRFKSIVLDPVTIIWEDWMDAYNTKYGGDIRGGQWKDVKAPWKLLFRRLQRSSLHVGMSAWVDDILYESVPGARGEESKNLSIRGQETPKVEKRLPHVFDMMLKFKVDLDPRTMDRTSVHRVTYTAGRRPRTIPATDLFVGKQWRFDAKQGDCNVWALVVEPILEKWGEGAIDHLGVDLQEVQEDIAETNRMAEDHAVGRLLRAIDEVTTFDALRVLYETQIATQAPYFSASAQTRIAAAKDKRKAELSK